MKHKKIRQYDGLYGENQTPLPTNYIFLEHIETRSKGFNWLIQPHIHVHLFQLFFIESGSLEFQTDTTPQRLCAPCILIIPPTILHGFTYSPDVSGRILTLSDTVVESILQELHTVSLFFNSLQILCFSADKQHCFESIMKQIVQINDELFTDQVEKQAMLKVYFSQLFLSLYRLALHKKDQPKIEDLTLKHFRTFQKNIRNAEYPKSVPQFAEELAVSPVHLNRICHAVVGKSASLLVKEYLMEQAQKYLLHTSYSVSEISYLMRFEYPNYFAKLFKKHTGLSPKEFRKMNVYEYRPD
ncbi:MAG: helix-turn-helix domain-containing protein [Cytophagales bacterium]|nr:MAG: helix-turn-helix domain-containing protein [Cytophagales bacterium]